MKASVVIPTYNRLAELQLVLHAIARQELPDHAELEVVVIDDGSCDGTWSWLKRQRMPYPLTLLHQQNSGPARARNRGVAAASGELILFLGDDTEPQPGWLMLHLEEHRIESQSDIAVLGYTSFPAQVGSPFRRTINELGAQFGYQLIDTPRDVPFNFFYTSNISLPKKVLAELGGFREDFPAAAWEDIELAYRATRKGLRMVYQPRARTLHHHAVTLRSFCRRQQISGESAAIFASLHPELSEFLGLERCRQTSLLPAAREWLLQQLVALGEQIPGLVPAIACRQLLDIAYLRGLRNSLISQEISGLTKKTPGG